MTDGTITILAFDRAAAEPERAAAEAAGELDHILPDLRPLAVRMDILNLDPANAQEHDPRNLKVIAGSVKQYKQRTPLTVNWADTLIVNRILKGNGTYVSMKMLGYKWVAAVGTEDDEDDAMGYGMLDNRSSELSKKNYSQTGTNLRKLKQTNHPSLELMYSEEESMPLLREEFLPAQETDEQFDASMLRGRAISKITASERLVVDQAIELCRAQSSKNLTEGSCLEKICREYLEITAVTTAVNLDIGGQAAADVADDVLPL